MEPSSQASNAPLPPGIEEADLYEGPKVIPLASGKASFVESQQGGEHGGRARAPDTATAGAALLAPIPRPEVSPMAQVKSEYPAVILLALDVLSARLLGLIALVTACLVWAGVVYQPDMWRVIAAGAFSILVLLPVMAIYWKAGLAGEEEGK